MLFQDFMWLTSSWSPKRNLNRCDKNNNKSTNMYICDGTFDVPGTVLSIFAGFLNLGTGELG